VTVDGHWRANDTAMTARMVLQGLGIGRLAALVGDPHGQAGGWCGCSIDVVDARPVPIYAVTATARQRLPKIRACIDYWASGSPGAARRLSRRASVERGGASTTIDARCTNGTSPRCGRTPTCWRSASSTR
jgi:hypothetical protein